MKIGLDPLPASRAEARPGHPVGRLADLLDRYLPDHTRTYVDGRDQYVEVYHSMGPVVRGPFLRCYGKRIITLCDVRFLLQPHLFGALERWVLLPLYRYDCRKADRLIAPTRLLREAVAETLHLAPERVAVLPSLDLLREEFPPELLPTAGVRAKYDLPERFLLMSGLAEPCHGQAVVLRAMIEYGIDFPIVLCGRRTAYTDELLGYVRRHGAAARVVFVYELDRKDLPAVFSLADGFVHLPRCNGSPLPVIEAMRAALPMVLSDTPLNRETAGDAARYLRSLMVGEVAAALENLVGDDLFRREYAARARQRARLYEAEAVARRLERIYSSL